jgi:hypothetical protein
MGDITTSVSLSTTTGSWSVPIRNTTYEWLSSTDNTNWSTTNITQSSSSFFGLDDTYLRTVVRGVDGNLTPVSASSLSIYTNDMTFKSVVLQLNGDVMMSVLKDTFLDSSSNNFTITKNGSVTQGTFSPFPLSRATYNPAVHGGSAYFNGSTDYLTVSKSSVWAPYNSSWTMECWINRTANAGTYGEFSAACIAGTTTGSDGFEWNISGTGTNIEVIFKNSSTVGASFNFALNQWYHVAVVKDGSKLMIFVDGNKIAENASLSPWTDLTVLSIGRLNASPYFYYFPGYISNFRVVNGTALYTSNFTRPTAPLTTTSNGGATPSIAPTASQVSLLCDFTNSSILDSVGKNDLMILGDAKVINSVKKYGTGSLYFDGNGDYLTVPSSNNFNFGTRDFTIEFWANSLDVSSVSQRGFLQTSDVVGGLKASYTSGITIGQGVGGTITVELTGGLWANIAGTFIGSSTPILTTDTWYHIAVVRNNGVVRTYVNGSVHASGIANGDCVGTNLCVGGYYNTEYLYNGYIDDLRITRAARYTGATFTF